MELTNETTRLPPEPVSKLEVIRLLVVKCPSVTFHNVVAAVNGAADVFLWGQENRLGPAEVVARIIDLYDLPTMAPVDPGQNTYGRAIPEQWEEGIRRARRGDRDGV